MCCGRRPAASEVLPTLVLLPGLDGTGRLFTALIGALPAGTRAIPVSYAQRERATLPELVAEVRSALPPEPYLLVAESFSGPVAIALAASAPPGCAGVVLVATFRRHPLRVPRWASALVTPVLARIPPPRWLLRWALVGRDAEPALVAALSAAIASVPPAVLAGRLRLLNGVDAGSALRQVQLPVLYLRATQDRVVPAFNARDLARLCPAMQIAAVRGPHLLLQRRPVEALSVIAAWCTR